MVGWIAVLSLAACGTQEERQIQWQLPLAPSPDAHAAGAADQLPAWAKEKHGIAVLNLLNKHTAKLQSLRVSTEQEALWGKRRIRLLGLATGLRLKAGAYTEDKNVHNPAAFIEVYDAQGTIFRGWIYQNFPELFGLDDKDWRVWLKEVRLQDDQRARSSAG